MANGWPIRRAGLTLFELLVVIAVIVAIGALVLPTTTSLMGRAAFDADVQRLRTAVIETSVIAKRAATPLALTLEDRSLVARPWPTEDEGDEASPILRVPLAEIRDADGEPLEDPLLVAVALPDGSFAVNGPLTVQGEDGGRVTLQIDPTSGFVKASGP